MNGSSGNTKRVDVVAVLEAAERLAGGFDADMANDIRKVRGVCAELIAADNELDAARVDLDPSDAACRLRVSNAYCRRAVALDACEKPQ
jgi:hypothetical protein